MDVYSGVRWTAVATYGCQALQFVTSIVLARLLAPEYFGLLAMAQVFIGFAGTFSTMGFSQAIVQRKRITEELLSSLFFVTLGVACLITTILFCASPIFAWLYRNPEVTPIIATLSVTFILYAPCLVPNALLTRRLAFNRLAVIDISMAVLTATAAIVLAWFGWGVWALVWPTVAGPLVRVPMLYAASAWRPRPLFRWSEVRSVMGFGANLTGFTIFNYFSRNADNLIIGIFLGAGPLGFYSLAYGVLLKPRKAVTGVLTRVLFPAFSQMQDDNARLKDTYLRACSAIAFATFPMMLGLVAVAHPFVDVVLGAKWLPAVPLIYVFAPLGMVHSITSTLGQVLLAKGRADWMFRVGIVGGSFGVCGFLFGVQWGTIGVALSYCVTTAFVLPIQLYCAARLLETGYAQFAREFLAAIRPHGVASATMATIVWILQQALHSVGVTQPVMLALCVLAGICTYVALIYCMRPAALSDFAKLLPGTISRFARSKSPRATEA